MSEARHTPQGDTSFRTSLIRTVGGAVALIALTAVVFAAIGMLGRDDDDSSPTASPAAEGDDAAAPDPDTPGGDEADDGDDPEVAGPEDDATGEDSDDAEADDSTDDAPAADRAFDPADVSVQVLDGYQADGGAAARAVAATLRDEGYRIIAENPALRYEVTTVLWTPGFEEQARQVAADINAPEVREQPGNLSTQVQVHVVVGSDRG